ncbi:hypothetical protein IAT38_003137 [Cryptococcus sp. DSM 104549]
MPHLFIQSPLGAPPTLPPKIAISRSASSSVTSLASVDSRQLFYQKSAVSLPLRLSSLPGDGTVQDGDGAQQGGRMREEMDIMLDSHGSPITLPPLLPPVQPTTPLFPTSPTLSPHSSPSQSSPTASSQVSSTPSSPLPGTPASISGNAKPLPALPQPRASDSSKGAHMAKAIYPGEPYEDRSFSVSRVPSKPRLLKIASSFVQDENGELVSFGDFFPPNGPSPSGVPVQKTVVFFIRSFWCGQCQDYTMASISILSPEAMEKAGIRVVVIGQGNWKIIKAYKRMFGCPFPIYVDTTADLYSYMGMTKPMTSFGPWYNGRADYHQSSVPNQIRKGLSNGLFRLPFARPGKNSQDGGEFVLTPGFNCEFAHRMTTASDHMEAPDVARIAGCQYPTQDDVRNMELADAQKEQLAQLEREMEAWRRGRLAELERIKERKSARRARSSIASRLEFSYPHDGDEPSSLDPDDFFQSHFTPPVISHTPSTTPPLRDSRQSPSHAAQREYLAHPALPSLLSRDSDIHKTSSELEDELNSRFANIMRQEETRAKEHAAAEMLATCLIAPPEKLEKEFGRKEVQGEIELEAEIGLAR